MYGKKSKVKTQAVYRNVSDSEDEQRAEDEAGISGSGGAFAALLDDDDGEWESVPTRKNKGKEVARVASAMAKTSLASRPAASGNTPAVPAKSTAPARPFVKPPAATVAAPRISPRPQTHGTDGKPISRDYYKAFCKCFRNPKGEICFRFHATDIVKVLPTGDVVLTTGTYFTYTTFLSMNDALQHLNIRLKYQGDIKDGNWTVVDSDGKSYSYQDEMVLEARTAADKSRGSVLLAAINSPEGAASESAGRQEAASPSQPQQYQPPIPGWNPTAPAGKAGASFVDRMQTQNTYMAQYQAQMSQTGASTVAGATSSSAAISGLNPGPYEVPEVPVNANLTAEHFEALLGGEDHLDDENYCVVCFENMRNTVLMPCGHVVLCSVCISNMKDAAKQCPVCREHISDFIELEL